jgi:hypothetical protein
MVRQLEPGCIGFRMNYEFFEGGEWQRVKDFYVFKDFPIQDLLPSHVRVRDIKVKKEFRTIH